MQLSKISSYNRNQYNNSQSKGQNPAFQAYPGKQLKGAIMKSIYEDFRFKNNSEKEINNILKKINNFLNLLEDSGNNFTKLDIVEGTPEKQGLVKLVISNKKLDDFVQTPALDKQLQKKSFYKEIIDNTYEIINNFDKSEDVLIRKNMSNLLEQSPSTDQLNYFGEKCGGAMARKCSKEADLAQNILSGLKDF